MQNIKESPPKEEWATGIKSTLSNQTEHKILNNDNNEERFVEDFCFWLNTKESRDQLGEWTYI